MTGLSIVPVKVKAKGSSRTTLTYAFLDGGSNTSFCSQQLMESLGADGDRATLSLTTLGNHDSINECKVFKLEVFDLDENELVKLHTVFSTPKLPVSKESIPKQSDVARFPYLRDIQILEIDVDIGLLIGNDAPKALEPREVRQSEGQGPYATRTVFGWTFRKEWKITTYNKLHKSRQ